MIATSRTRSARRLRAPMANATVNHGFARGPAPRAAATGGFRRCRSGGMTVSASHVKPAFAGVPNDDRLKPSTEVVRCLKAAGRKEIVMHDRFLRSMIIAAVAVAIAAPVIGASAQNPAASAQHRRRPGANLICRASGPTNSIRRSSVRPDTRTKNISPRPSGTNSTGSERRSTARNGRRGPALNSTSPAHTITLCSCPTNTSARARR
jgi:hypothetical protein